MTSIFYDINHALLNGSQEDQRGFPLILGGFAILAILILILGGN